jgi:hypothetical protein
LSAGRQNARRSEACWLGPPRASAALWCCAARPRRGNRAAERNGRRREGGWRADLHADRGGAGNQPSCADLHRFLLPFADHLERLPDPQRDALRSTFGLVAGPPADRFLVAPGVLTLLPDVAAAVPLVCVADDVQWLDPESVLVLGLWRVACTPTGWCCRWLAGQLPALAGVPELAIAGLDDGAALDLL